MGDVHMLCSATRHKMVITVIRASILFSGAAVSRQNDWRFSQVVFGMAPFVTRHNNFSAGMHEVQASPKTNMAKY